MASSTCARFSYDSSVPADGREEVQSNINLQISLFQFVKVIVQDDVQGFHWNNLLIMHTSSHCGIQQGRLWIASHVPLYHHT